MEVIRGFDGQPAHELDLAAAGDEAAFTRIVALHQPAMVRVAYLIAGDLDLADEAVARAWPLAWRNLRSVRDADRLASWLVTIAANEARRLSRDRRRRALREVPVEEAQDVAATERRGPVDLDLRTALLRLSPDDRTLLALRYVAGFDATEIGRATGRSPSGTRVRLSRLLERMRKELGDD